MVTDKPFFKKFIYGLMVAYVLYVVSSLFIVDRQMERAERYTQEVTEGISDLRQRCNEMEIFLPRLMSHPRINQDVIASELARQDQLLTRDYEYLAKIFRGSPVVLAEVRKAVDALISAKKALAVQLEGNLLPEVAQNGFQELVHPAIDKVDISLDAVTASVRAHGMGVHNSLHVRMLLITIAAVVAGCLIICVTYLYNKAIKRATRELAYRENLFIQLAASIDEVFIITANVDHFKYVSGNCERELGLAPEAILRDANVFYNFLPPDIAVWLKGLLAGREHDGPKECDFSVPSLDKYLKLRIYCLYMPPADNGSCTIVISDQTSVMRHQQALRGALESSRAASEAKSCFFSHMSHEIRTPMNAIIGMTTIALSRIDDQARVRDCLCKISDSSRHLLRLINDVLDMSKIESGKLAIVHESFNLHEVIANITNIVRAQVQEQRQDFDIFLEDVDEENLVGDAMRLNQVLLNILSNAIKFTPKGGKITLRLKQLEKKNNRIRIRFTIADTGIGMSQEHLEKLYHPFEQATATTAAKYGGTGLGMSITANLVTMMGGSINVSSQEGVGTTFFVEIPFELSGKVTFEPNSLPPFKVLVIDDDEGTCEHAELLLEEMGLKPTWTMSAEEGVELARDAHRAGDGFDICLIDWNMPRMNGAQTAKAIRQAVGGDTLIIIVSAYDWASIQDDALRSGVDHFMPKPLFASTLYNTIVASSHKLGVDTSCDDRVVNQQEYDFSGRRVLLVEDNEFNQEIAQEFLEMVHVETDIAENGKEAVDKMTNSLPGYYDLILMDVQMPVMDGYEATRTIRASSHPDAQTIGIIAMTANAFVEDVARAVASGMNGHVAKPIDVSALYQTLASYFRDRETSSPEEKKSS